jgi:hypoxanthine-guanine phosphoribosyltransferase
MYFCYSLLLEQLNARMQIQSLLPEVLMFTFPQKFLGGYGLDRALKR